MPALGTRTFYEFRLQIPADLSGVLEVVTRELAASAPGNGAPELAKLYQYLEPLYRLASNPSPRLPEGVIDQATVSLLDADLADMALDPDLDPELVIALSVEISLVAAATGNMKGITPYTFEEFKAVLAGTDAIYHDIIFVHTLRSLIGGPGNQEYAAHILKALPGKTSREDNYAGYFWDSALVFSLLLQAAWRFFPSLPSVSQQYLLQNYFYQALASGVPVRYWLGAALDRGPVGGSRTLSNFFVQAVTGSREEVVLNPIAGEGRNLTEFVRGYFRGLTANELPAIAQEKYLNSFYADPELREAFGPWARELLTIMVLLKDGAIKI